MADVIRTALDTHRLVSHGYLAMCTAPGCEWQVWNAVRDDSREAALARQQVHRAHQAEVATAAVLEVTEAAVYDAFSSGPPLQAHDIVHAIAAALAGEG